MSSPESTAKTADSGIESLAKRLSEDVNLGSSEGSSPLPPSTGNEQVDQALVFHLVYCERLLEVYTCIDFNEMKLFLKHHFTISNSSCLISIWGGWLSWCLHIERYKWFLFSKKVLCSSILRKSYDWVKKFSDLWKITAFHKLCMVINGIYTMYFYTNW